MGNTNCTLASEYDSLPICCAGGSGTFISSSNIFPGYEQSSPAATSILYLALLLWLFMGVAMAADVFMAAIETITSTVTLVKNKMPDGHVRHFRVRTWNATVANLTLMALGSSAPEILLSVIELLSNGWYSGSLGPSTIVGSAAFNLFVIIAVCVVAIPADDSRKIAQPRVYAVTAFFSVFAYVWLVIVLLGTTPEIVDLPEAILTLFFFPLVVWMAYVVDKWSTSPKFKEKWSKRFGLKHEEASAEELLPSTVLLDVKHPDGSPLSADELLTMVKRLRRTATGLAVSEEKAVSVIAQQMASQQPKSRAYHRIAATRKTVGGKDLKAPKLTEDSIQPAKHSKGTVKIEPEPAKPEKPSRASATHSVVEWACDKYAVVEAAGTVTVQVRRDGALDQAVSVVYSSIDGTAKAGEDFELAAGTIDFAPGEDSHDITIKIFDDDEIEPDEVFTVALQEVVKGDASLGDLAVTQVTVINDDFPGTFVFEDEDLKVKEDVGVYMLPVQRVQGCSGAVSLKYATRDGSAKHGKNYEEAKGTLEWAHQDVQPKHIAIPITNDSVMSGNLFFEVEIHSATGDAQFDERTDGSKERSIARVTIIDDDAVKGIAERAINLLGMSQQTVNMGASSWKEQWINAFSVVPKDDDEEDEEGGELEGEAAPASADDKKVGPIFGHTLGEWALHVLTFPFKLACAIIPPTNIAGGIPCFFIAIVVIGVMTALIGDMANMLGCALGIESAVVAITFVALGTSLPDTFASMSAARGDATADAAIGNVTGSNAVNVFLGLGLSWMLGAIVWVSNGVDKKWLARYPQIVELYAKQGIVIVEGTRLGLAVPSGDLAVGVIVFSICAIVCIGVLFARRVFFGGELGNRMRYPTAILFVSLWLLYVSISTWMTYSSKAK